MSSIADRLLQIRGKVKQKAFADTLGINANTLRGYESGRVLPNHEFLEKICVQFSVNPKWLLLGTGPMKTGEKNPVKENIRGVEGAWTNTGLEVRIKLLEDQLAEALAAKDQAMQEALNAYKLALKVARAEANKAKENTDSLGKGDSKSIA